MHLNFRPVVLIILDGFGIAPPSSSNAICLGKKPFFDSLIKDYPIMLLQASGLSVGLPFGEVGNSEVGHMSIGSGILRYQSLPRIDNYILSGDFFKLPGLQKIIQRVKNTKHKLHIIGLLGNGCVHASQAHLEALLDFVRQGQIGKNTYFHLFMDGRDTAKNEGRQFMVELLESCRKKDSGQVATISGRFYGMDRNKNWDRVQKSYNAIVYGKADKTHTSPIGAIEESYAQEVFDEEMDPVVFVDNKNKPLTIIEEGDSVVFFNYRADRARQLTEALVEEEFDKFEHKKFKDLYMATFAEYKKGLPVEVFFPPEIIENPMAKILSENNLKQLHIAETEKYAHVTFFLNGMQEKPFKGEERILIPSPDVTSYDQKPEMSALKVTQEVIKALKQDTFDFIVINYANTDMVGHTGNLKACIKSVEVVDNCLTQVVPEVVKRGGIVFIVGDHGNAEEMFDYVTGQIDKEHNKFPVPFMIVSNKFSGRANTDIIDNEISALTPAGVLSDITPTILELVGLPKMLEMTGCCLLKK